MKVIERNNFEYDIVFVSVDVYSELMGVSKHILYHLIERGKITHLKLTRSVRIPISLVNSNKNPPDSVYKTRRELKKQFNIHYAAHLMWAVFLCLPRAESQSPYFWTLFVRELQ